MYKLKPCPFCGGRVHLYYRSKPSMYVFEHSDDNSFSCVEGAIFRGAKSLREASEMWNRRTKDNV